MMIARIALALALLVAAGPAAADEAVHAPEPEGFWTGPMQGAVPATLAGGTVVDAAGLAALIDSADPLRVDVGPAPRQPEGLSPDTVWAPPPHRTIPGSVWLPGVGQGELSPARDAWYREQLHKLTGGDTARPMVVFCHPNCWGSWNAAKRAILYGYTRVHWFPDGIEGWQDSGRPTATVEAVPGPE